MNNNNRNGKEVHKGQTPENLPKEDKARPVNRVKKKNTPARNDITPGAPKKIPLNINKNPGNTPKSSPKGHIIKLEEKDPGIHSVQAPPRENRRPQIRPQPATSNRNTISAESSVYKESPENKEMGKVEKESLKLSGNTGKWLLVAAVLFFIAWAVIFFYYKIGGNSHMLLALSVLCAIVSLTGRKNK